MLGNVVTNTNYQNNCLSDMLIKHQSNELAYILCACARACVCVEYTILLLTHSLTHNNNGLTLFLVINS